MKKNRYSSIVIILIVALFTFVACGGGVSIPDEYNYEDLSKYIKLGNYKGIEYSKEEISISQDEIETYIHEQMKQNATETKKVKSGVAKKDSIANINYVGSIDGVEFEGGAGENYDLDLANSTFIDGFAEEIIGHSVGETFDVNVTFPEDYGKAELAGKPAVFVTTINYLSEKVVPEYNLDYVKNNTDYDSIEDYEKSIEEMLITQEKNQSAQKNFKTVFDKVVSASKLIECPDKEYNLRLNTLNGDKKRAKQQVKEDLVLYAVARSEGLKFTDSDYQEYIDELLSQSGVSAEDFEASYNMSIEEYAEKNGLYITFLYGKVMEKVMSYSVEK